MTQKQDTKCGSEEDGCPETGVVGPESIACPRGKISILIGRDGLDAGWNGYNYCPCWDSSVTFGDRAMDSDDIGRGVVFDSHPV